MQDISFVACRELKTRIYFAQDRVLWWSPVNVVTCIHVAQKAENFLTSWMSASQGICIMELHYQNVGAGQICGC